MSSDHSARTSKESGTDSPDELDPVSAEDAQTDDQPDAKQSSDEVAQDVSEKAVSGQGKSAVAHESGSALPRRLVYLAAALATAAFLAAAVFGVLWWISSSSDTASLSGERDEVLQVGTSVLRTVTELDYHNPDQYFDRSIAVSTEDFGKQITAGRDDRKQALVQNKTMVTTTILDAAVDELNVDQGKANVLAALRVEIKQGDATANRIIRIAAELTRLDQNGKRSWKLSGIDPIAVVG